MWLVPSKKQWQGWSLPGKASYLSLPIALVGLVITLAAVPWWPLIWKTTPYVFVQPGGVIKGDTWVFVLRHRGSDPIFNTTVWFEDVDMKNAAVKNHDTGLLHRSLQSFEFPEIVGNELFAIRFFWTPLTIGHSHFEMRLTARNNMTLNESLWIQRTTGGFQYAMAVDDVASSRTMLICKDSHFPGILEGRMARELPPCFPTFGNGSQAAFVFSNY